MFYEQGLPYMVNPVFKFMFVRLSMSKKWSVASNKKDTIERQYGSVFKCYSYFILL